MSDQLYNLKNILSTMICQTFEELIGKGHINIILKVSFECDKKQIKNLFLYAPGNYVYVVEQDTTSSLNNDSNLDNMKLLSCHDSCWRSDGVENWVRKNFDSFERIGYFSGISKIENNFIMSDKFKQLDRERSM
jgi:hypothetical protein